MRFHWRADENDSKCDGQIPQDNDGDEGVCDSLEPSGDKDSTEEYQN